MAQARTCVERCTRILALSVLPVDNSVDLLADAQVAYRRRAGPPPSPTGQIPRSGATMGWGVNGRGGQGGACEV
eukprot:3322322-Alexandrium_andersonii.AAC.1